MIMPVRMAQASRATFPAFRQFGPIHFCLGFFIGDVYSDIEKTPHKEAFRGKSYLYYAHNFIWSNVLDRFATTFHCRSIYVLNAAVLF